MRDADPTCEFAGVGHAPWPCKLCHPVRHCGCGEFDLTPLLENPINMAYVEAERDGVRMVHSQRKCVDFNSLPAWGPVE